MEVQIHTNTRAGDLHIPLFDLYSMLDVGGRFSTLRMVWLPKIDLLASRTEIQPKLTLSCPSLSGHSLLDSTA